MQTAVDDPEERIKIFNKKKCQRHCRKSHCKNFSEGCYDVVKGNGQTRGIFRAQLSIYDEPFLRK